MNTNEGQARYEWLQAINYKTNFFLKNEILQYVKIYLYIIILIIQNICAQDQNLIYWN